MARLVNADKWAEKRVGEKKKQATSSFSAKMLSTGVNITKQDMGGGTQTSYV